MKGIGFYGNDFYFINYDEKLIKENIIRIILTSPGERVMSNFGSKLKSFLMNQENVLREEVEDEIISSITKWEPRVNVINIEVESTEENTARVRLDLQIKQTLNNLNLDTIIRV